MKIKLVSLLILICLLLTACGTPEETSSVSKTESEESIIQETKTFTIDEDEIYDKILGSWVGQAAGVVWGANTEFRYQKKLIPDNEVPAIETLNLNDVSFQDDLYVEIPFLEAMNQFGVNCSLNNWRINSVILSSGLIMRIKSAEKTCVMALKHRCQDIMRTIFMPMI